MQHLFCGVSPAALGEIPFAPAFRWGQQLRAAELGIRVHPDAGLYVFPNVGGFVGGDTVAGILANGLLDAEAPTMLIDIGTNGEIVLAVEGRLYAASTAAGPAFEGARITQGMRAASGAIEKVVRRDGDLACNVIGGGPAAGICGTALIDVVAELLRLGVLDSSGRLLGDGERPGSLSRALTSRLHEADGDVNVLLSAAAASGGEPIYLHQRDVRELQLASGALRAGMQIMLKRLGLQVQDLDAVLLAGGFGNYIRRENARRIGLLPAVPLERVRFVGNAASIGARDALLSMGSRRLTNHIAEATEHVDLSLDPDFQMAFGMAMMFPENEDGTSAADTMAMM
jgi:uncharacterized 2Fe-2S/4Fe-4S cluster protein (DUF4445 family)